MSLEVRNISLLRGTRLLQSSISFSLNAGQALWLRGPNGVGKSTLLEALCGFRRPSIGQIIWKNTDISDELDSFHDDLSYIGHLNGNNESLKAEAALAYYAKIYNSNRLENSLTVLGLENRKEVEVKQLSAGQKKRLALARLLLRDVPLWILDEPSVSLDQDGADLLAKMMTNQIARGGSIIFTSHTKLDLPCKEFHLERLTQKEVSVKDEFLSKDWDAVI